MEEDEEEGGGGVESGPEERPTSLTSYVSSSSSRNESRYFYCVFFFPFDNTRQEFVANNEQTEFILATRYLVSSRATCPICPSIARAS